ncbi:hypothetical protein M011DRAFT_394089 [Sporormia fimetaria CBS 119925]|uniref:HRDC domain-containing protein n=1 Tax=Sporormia fimetaria CBS 119925 TaxID=1340428 RepID=A0A6A6VQE7_9PLEO|nr:hypothetical protein M011DRAFT_394089 [Sporormia fimetaria CBS 119925]
MDSFKELQESISNALVSTTRTATRIGAADIPFQRTLNPEVATALDEQNARLLQLAQRLLANAASSSEATAPKLPDVDAIDGNWRGIIDVVDSLLERADTALDEYTGVVKRLAQTGAQPNEPAKKIRMTHLPNTWPKPQLSFEHVPQNNETGGFRPLLTSKPHAKVPFAECFKTFKDDNGREQYPHPYQTEIESYQYPPWMYEKSDPQPYPPFESTTAALVDTPEALAEMLAELKKAKEIAIDLEHHDNRSYIGLVSLMQISTRDRDWIVDTLKPWRRQLQCLNEVFADPNIIKVLHGAYMDIVWLQRDLGLYIVGLFDTFHAARSLGYTGASLAFLLSKFANFQAQKQFQMADWRIRRPLSADLFNYARADTHFLLYIFDNMRNELIDRSDFSNPQLDKVSEVLEKSRETSLKRYEHPVYDTETGLGNGGWYRLITRTPVRYTPQQFAVFRAVHKWRDDVARAEDESPLFVMPNHVVFSIARVLPADKAALFAVTQHMSHILRARADELVAVINRTKDLPNPPDLDETLNKISAMLYQAREERKGAVAKPVLEEAPAVSTLNLTPMFPTPVGPPPRAEESKFWGSLLSGGASTQRSQDVVDITLGIPLPPLTAEVFAETVGSTAAEETPKPEPKFIPKEERPGEDKRTDIFIVKQLGGKRKRGAVDSPATPSRDADLAGNADEVMLEEDPEESRRAAKALKKQQKKEKKRLEALRQAGEEDVEEQEEAKEEEEAPFDYASAPSVMRAHDAERNRNKNEGGKKKKEEKKKSAAYNPYAKLADVPKGLARTQKEKAGRSKTFRS